MAIFNRKNASKDKGRQELSGENSADEDVTSTNAAGTGAGDDKKVKKKRPANTAFKQQRLKAWQPILTPKSVLPTLFIIGILFAPIGGLLIWGSNKVTRIQLEYTNCDTEAPTDGSSQTMPSSAYEYALSSYKTGTYNPPRWSFSNSSSRAVGQQAICTITFDVPYDLPPSVFFYYRLTNFYQNTRRYVQSMDSSQLKGVSRTVSQIDSGNCKPITSQNGKAYYPCGLIANSLFNDSFSGWTLTNPTNGQSSQAYNFTSNGIAWSGEAKKYTNNPPGSPSDYLPPPNWALEYPDGTYTSFPQLASNEHFQVWMRTAALPTFSKLWARNDQETMQAGTYTFDTYMNYPVKNFDGTKSVVLTTVSWIGGKQPFLGWSYIAVAALCILFGILGTAKQLIRPRKLGDMSLLSWNQPQAGAAR